MSDGKPKRTYYYVTRVVYIDGASPCVFLRKMRSRSIPADRVYNGTRSVQKRMYYPTRQEAFNALIKSVNELPGAEVWFNA